MHRAFLQCVFGALITLYCKELNTIENPNFVFYEGRINKICFKSMLRLNYKMVGEQMCEENLRNHDLTS